MTDLRWAALGAALALASCVEARPFVLADDHPAGPGAAAGLVATPTALEEYRRAEDFAARAAADRSAPSAPAGHAHGGRR
jgi:hypothetical protein